MKQNLRNQSNIIDYFDEDAYKCLVKKVIVENTEFVTCSLKNKNLKIIIKYKLMEIEKKIAITRISSKKSYHN